MLALQCGKRKFKLSAPVIIGRKDFPTQNLMSRQHFEVRQDEAGRVFVKDLGSVNGTSLHGRRLKPNEPVELTPNDPLMAGGLTFVITEMQSLPIEHRHIAAIGIFVALFLSLLVTPSMAFGRAVGASGLAIIASTLLVPFLLSFAFFEYLRRFQQWPKHLIKFSLAVLISTLALNDLLVEIVNSETTAGLVLLENKIRYYCLAKFQPDMCVRQINACPHCPKRIGNDDRREITERLKTYYREPASTYKSVPAEK